MYYHLPFAGDLFWIFFHINKIIRKSKTEFVTLKFLTSIRLRNIWHFTTLFLGNIINTWFILSFSPFICWIRWWFSGLLKRSFRWILCFRSGSFFMFSIRTRTRRRRIFCSSFRRIFCSRFRRRIFCSILRKCDT